MYNIGTSVSMVQRWNLKVCEFLFMLMSCVVVQELSDVPCGGARLGAEERLRQGEECFATVHPEIKYKKLTLKSFNIPNCTFSISRRPFPESRMIPSIK